MYKKKKKRTGTIENVKKSSLKLCHAMSEIFNLVHENNYLFGRHISNPEQSVTQTIGNTDATFKALF
jgi:hypothetical protein